MSNVTLTSIQKSYGAVEVIPGIDLDIRSGEFCVFVGPSGCGKSTLLRMIAGLEETSGGEIRIGTRDVTHVEAAERGVAMVFQNYALYPHMTIAENMGFALRIAKRPKAEIEAAVSNAAGILQIEHLLERKPRELSGGQRQRVAIGRAITRSPDVFLFDEPLSNLDAALRIQMRVEIARLHNELKNTMIYVTHDQTEAMTMADRIVVLNAGRIEQFGRPMELYLQPANLFVAGFIGAPNMNFLDGEIEGNGEGSVFVRKGMRLPLGLSAASGKATLGIRPENLRPVDTNNADIVGKVMVVEQLGATSLVHVEIEGGPVVIAIAEGLTKARAGQTLGLEIEPHTWHVFGGDGKRIASGGKNLVESEAG